MRTRSIPVLCMALSVVLCHFAANGNQALGWQVADDEVTASAAEFKFYPLKYVRAENAKPVIENIIGGMTGPVTITADVRANSLIVVARDQEQAIIRDLISKLDIETREPVETKLPGEHRIISYTGLNPNSIMKALDSFKGRGQVGVEVVEELGIVVVTGDKDDVDRVQKVFKQIVESAPAKSKESSVYVSMTFIVESSQIDEKVRAEFSPPNQQIKSVISKSAEAGLISINDPVVVSKTVNRVRVNHQLSINDQKEAGFAPSFVNRSESGGKRYAMRNAGYITQLSGKMFQVQAELDLKVNSQLEGQLQGSTELNTEIEVPLNHPVLMSFSTILGVDSAVVIQIHEAK